MKVKNILLGLGFEAKDRHTRITKGKNFYILGGSKTTHQSMQENCIKFNEELDKRSKDLNNISPEEFYDIAHKIGLQVPREKLKEE